MPIEPVKIPQDVQIEDRLIGPITLRQVIICLIGGGISFVIWNGMKAAGPVNTGHLIVAWTPLLITAAFAFIRFQNLSLLKIILLAVEGWEKPNLRAFEPRTGIAINVRTYFNTQQDAHIARAQTEPMQGKFEQLSSLLDERPSKDGAPVVAKEKGEEATEEQPKAVNPERVSVDPLERNKQGSLDGVAHMPTSAKQAPVIRDIAPPSA